MELRRTLVTPGRTVTSTVAVLTPGGKPDLNKPHDSVQANLISRVCAMKKDEHQIPEDRPALLIADFAHFGGPVGAEFLKSGQSAPLESGHQGITCGSIWYGMYGWKGAPIFEEGSHRLVSMGHDGRFRISGPKKSKLSAVLVVFSDSAVLLENLDVREIELQTIDDLSPLLGRSPRALKRFVNVYRLIKARLTPLEHNAFMRHNDAASLKPCCGC